MTTGILVDPAAVVVRKLLTDEAVGTFPPVPPTTPDAWPIYAMHEPGEPGDCITVFEDGSGDDNGKTMQGERVERQGIRIKVRCNTEVEGYAKAYEIAGLLDRVARREVAVNSRTYVVWSFKRATGPVQGGQETDSDRYSFVMSGTVGVRLRT